MLHTRRRCVPPIHRPIRARLHFEGVPKLAIRLATWSAGEFPARVEDGEREVGELVPAFGGGHGPGWDVEVVVLGGEDLLGSAIGEGREHCESQRSRCREHDGRMMFRRRKD